MKSLKSGYRGSELSQLQVKSAGTVFIEVLHNVKGSQE